MRRQSLQLELGVLIIALCWPLGARAVDVQYLVSLRTEVRVRNSLPGIDRVCPSVADCKSPITGDLEIAPLGQLSLGLENSTFLFQYAPTFIWREPVSGGPLLPLQRGRVTWAYRWQRATLLLGEDGAWGLTDITSARSPEGGLPGGVNEVQTLGSVPYLRSATLINLEARPTDRFSLSLNAGYTISGSPEGTVGGLPLQHGPSGSLRARVVVDREQDALTTSAQVVSSRFVTVYPGGEQLIAQLTESWDRPWSRTLSSSLGAGVALTREVIVSAEQGLPGTYLEPLPIATGSIAWNDVVAHHPLRVGVSLRMAPFADRFTALVYERLEGRVQADLQPAREWAVMAAASGALAVPVGRSEQAGDRLVSGEATVTWTAKTWLLLQASARVLWTEQPRLGLPGQVQAVGTVSATVRQQDSLAW